MKKCTNKRISSVILALLVLLFAVGLFFRTFHDKYEFYLEKYANADAKFYEEYIVTSVDEKIQLLDFQGKMVKSFDDLKASWLYTFQEEGLIIYSNHDNETHLMRLDETMELLSDKVILTTELLAIDPTICKVEDTYLVTCTTIEGTINNPDPEGDNGIYTLELFASKDLENWEHRCTVISEKQDIEDIDLMYEDKILYCIYEKEDYDKGPSKICMKASEDQGLTWSEEKILVDNGGDNEPACILREENGYRLFYSSDVACQGESYNGASIYSTLFDENFEVSGEREQKLSMKNNTGIRLYEVCKSGNALYVMYAHNFMTDKDFVLQKVEID